MTDVILYITAKRTMEIGHELRNMGYVQGVDFDFAYNQSQWDNMIGEIPKQTVFTFYNDSNASYFMLRWG